MKSVFFLVLCFSVLFGQNYKEKGFTEYFNDLSQWTSVGNGGNWEIEDGVLNVDGYGRYPNQKFQKIQSKMFKVPNNTFTVEFKWQVNSVSDQSAVWLEDENGKSLFQVTDYSSILGFYEPGNILRHNQIRLGKWYNIRAKVFLDEGYADFYVDGSLAQSHVNFPSGEFRSSKRMRFVLGSWGGDSFKIDDMIVQR